MKQEDTKREDPQLSQLLKTWQMDEPLPPRFQECVWNRIETAEPGGIEQARPEILARLFMLFGRPAFATVCAAVLLFAGLATGFMRAERDAGRMNMELAQRYVASVDPYAVQTH